MVEDRISIDLWRDVRSWMVENDPDASRMIEWSRNDCRPPDHPEKMAGEIVWIILCAGKTAQAARTIERRVREALFEGTPVVDAYGHKGRAAAIEAAWRDRDRLFGELSLVIDDRIALMNWCRALPWVGDVTAFQLMKNFGVDCPKPDIWLSRLSGIPDRPVGRVERRFEACSNLCRRLGEATEDTLSTVDSILWLACNKGILQVSADAGPIVFAPRTITARSIID